MKLYDTFSKSVCISCFPITQSIQLTLLASSRLHLFRLLVGLSFWVPRNPETQWDGLTVHITVYLQRVCWVASCFAVGYKIWPPYGDPNKHQISPIVQTGSNSSSFALILLSFPLQLLGNNNLNSEDYQETRPISSCPSGECVSNSRASTWSRTPP